PMPFIGSLLLLVPMSTPLSLDELLLSRARLRFTEATGPNRGEIRSLRCAPFPAAIHTNLLADWASNPL
ncbi:MAG: hypothetical protein FWC43_14670, partial [Planctomycetaceae bacterium]|nr:hypothetical protein [Planctomycetaceae bacterium]